MMNIIDQIIKEAYWVGKIAGNISIYWKMKGTDDYAFSSNRKYPTIVVKRLGEDKFNVLILRSLAEAIKEFLSNVEKYYDDIGWWYKHDVYTKEYVNEHKDDKSLLRLIKVIIEHPLSHFRLDGMKERVKELLVKKDVDVNKQQLFDLLVSKNKLTLSIFESLYGEVESTERVQRLKHKNWDIYFDTKTKRDSKDLIELLDNTEDALKSNGFDFLCKGKVLAVDNLGGNRLADYEPSSDVVRIGFKELKRNSGRNLNSMIHELAHRNWYKFMGDVTKSEFAVKHYEMKMKTPEIKNGEIVIDKEKDNKYKVLEHKYNFIGKSSEYYLVELVGIGVGKSEEDLHKKYRIPSDMMGTSLVVEKPSQNDSDRASFVPDNYGLKSKEEFYAVLFAYYMLNGLQEPAKTWFKENNK